MDNNAELSPQEELTPAETPEITEDDEMGAAFDRLTSEGIEEEGEEAQEPSGRDEKGRFKKAEEASEEEQQEDPEQVERPKYFDSLPHELREAWDQMPDAARNAVADTYMKMSASAAQAGRMAKVLEPIRNTMAQAAKDFPELSNMTPEQVAADAMELAKTRAQLTRDPVGTLLAVAEQTGAMPGLIARLNGQQAPQGAETERQLRNQIAQLEQQVKNISNPDIIRGSVEQYSNEQRVLGEIQQWSAGKEHYQRVEPHLPAFIQAAQRTMPQASSSDLLDAAYNMATEAMGLRTAQAEVTPPPPAPQKTRRVLDAKSVNVASRGSKQTPMSEDEEMSAAWDRAMKG
ncbi:hypothetical protein [Celeribacter naphthalenivorans]|uniref:hypothetical protein n=1 Tax=Celeribacter naphthalenivorans TaxID=1614694 RepID=UPI001CF938BE|nr:hypothetical protein [Celeribacter naphthalenivorans]